MSGSEGHSRKTRYPTLPSSKVRLPQSVLTLPFSTVPAYSPAHTALPTLSSDFYLLLSAYCLLLSAFSEVTRNKFRGTRAKGPSYRILPASKATSLRASAAPRSKS